MERMKLFYRNNVKGFVNGCFKTRVKGGPDGYVFMGIAIIIVVALGIVFKDAVETFITNMMNAASTEALTWF